jgi:urea transport system substrate-binding protein
MAIPRNTTLPPAPSGRRLSRRNALGSGLAATLAASRVLAPSLFVGCSLGIPSRMPTVKIGLLHSQTGPLAIGSTSLRDGELDAVERFNAAGGVLGHRIEPQAPDPRSRTDLFPKRATALLDDGAVALFGGWTSDSRKALLPLLEQRDSLLFYPVQYEGNETSRNVIYGGQVPNQQVLPGLEWFRSAAGGERRKFFLIGSDYVYPRTTNFIVRKWLAGTDAAVVGEEYVPLDHADFAPVVARIVESGADCILNTVNGEGNLPLLAALFEAGIDPAKLPLVSTSISEDDLRSMPASHAVGQWMLSSYFQTVDTPANAAWMAGFRSEFGRDRVFGDAMESAWCLINLWKLAVEKAGSFATDAVRQAFAAGVAFEGPGGTMTIDPASQHATKHFRLGRVRRDRLCEVVVSSDAPLAPDPYPQIAFPGWRCDWTKGGIERGPEVSIDG